MPRSKLRKICNGFDKFCDEVDELSNDIERIARIIGAFLLLLLIASLIVAGSLMLILQ